MCAQSRTEIAVARKKPCADMVNDGFRDAILSGEFDAGANIWLPPC